MTFVGVVGSSGQLGSSLIRTLAKRAVPLGRSVELDPTITTLIWAAGSCHSRSSAQDVQRELISIKQATERINAHKLNHVLLVSSGGAIYKRVGNAAKYENCELDVSSPYAKLKLEVEELFREKFELLGVPLTILRLANVYSNNGTGLISSLLRNVKTGKPISIRVNPRSTKQYGHSDDYAAAISMYLNLSIENVSTRIYNVFSPHLYSIEHILKSFRKHWKVASEPLETLGEFPMDSIELATLFPDILGATKWRYLEEFLKTESLITK